MKEKKHKLLILLLLLNAFVWAQDMKQDFLNINKVYHKNTCVNMSMAYTLYENHSSTTAVEKLEGMVKRMGECMHYKLSHIEYLRNTKYNLMIDNQAKLMVLTEHNTKLFDWDEQAYFGNLDAYLKMCDKSTYSTQGAYAAYDLQIKSGKYSRVIISFDKKKYLIHKMVFYYREAIDISKDKSGKKSSPRLEIDFSGINTSVQYTENDFSEMNFLNKTEKNYTCKPAYKDFRLKVELFDKKTK